MLRQTLDAQAPMGHIDLGPKNNYAVVGQAPFTVTSLLAIVNQRLELIL